MFLNHNSLDFYLHVVSSIAAQMQNSFIFALLASDSPTERIDSISLESQELIFLKGSLPGGNIFENLLICSIF